MKVAVIYPPLFQQNKRPLLGQNRQFRYSSSCEVRIYPMIPALAATWVSKNGHEVLWLDAHNDLKLTQESFEKKLFTFSPDVILMEVKSPIIRRYWDYCFYLKNKLPDTKLVFCGDHVSFFPEESLQNSPIDYVLVGGDYDYSFSKLINFLDGKSSHVPGGVYYKDNGKIVNTGDPKFIKNLDIVPYIDRDLTKWYVYGEAYLRKPATYILTGRGCRGPKGISVCSFCIWQHALWRRTARLRSPENVVNEIEILVKKYKVREIFDDNESGAIWNQEWLEEFYRLLKQRKLIGKFSISSNARADCLTRDVCKLLKKIGYRLLKVGIESGSPRILNEIINKKESVEEIMQGIKNAKDVGLVCLLTNMVGYPGETEEEAEATYRMAKELMLYKTHAGDSLQASVLVAYPGTPLWKRALKNGWFIIDPEDYEEYKMDKPTLKCEIDAVAWCNKLWKIHLHPKFIFRSLVTARSIADLNVLWTGFKSLLGHLKDFTRRGSKNC